MVLWCTQAFGTMDDVQAHLGRAHPRRTGAVPIGELLTIVIVFLFADAQGCEGYAAVIGMVDVSMTRAGSSSEVEIIHDDC